MEDMKIGSIALFKGINLQWTLEWQGIIIFKCLNMMKSYFWQQISWQNSKQVMNEDTRSKEQTPQIWRPFTVRLMFYRNVYLMCAIFPVIRTGQEPCTHLPYVFCPLPIFHTPYHHVTDNALLEVSSFHESFSVYFYHIHMKYALWFQKRAEQSLEIYILSYLFLG